MDWFYGTIAAATMVISTACSTASTAAFDSAEGIGEAVGCETPLQRDRDSLAQEEKTCEVGADQVHIMRFSDRDTMDGFVGIGSAFGANYAVINDHWAVSSKNRALMQRLADEHGWQMQ